MFLITCFLPAATMKVVPTAGPEKRGRRLGSITSPLFKKVWETVSAGPVGFRSGLKTLLTVVLGYTLLISVAFAPNLVQEFGKITLPLGKVDLKSAGSNDWQKAMPRMPVNEKDIVRTLAKSRCEITLAGGGKVRIGENAELELSAASVKPMEKNFDANLKKGNIWVSAKAAFGEKKNVSVRTPTAVAAIRGTKYRAKAGTEESSVLVYDGKVDVNSAKAVIEEEQDQRKSQQGPGRKPKFTLGPVKEIQAPTEVAGPYEITLEEWITLAEGMQINVRKDGKYHMFEFDQAADANLDFVRWNKELDEQE